MNKVNGEATIFKMGEGLNLEPRPMKTEQKVCTHTSIVVDEAARSIECQTCGCVVDAFDWLWQRAFKGWIIAEDITRLRERLGEISRDVREMEKEERRIKARLMRAHRKLSADDLEAFFRDAFREGRRTHWYSGFSRAYKQWTGRDLDELRKEIDNE